LIDLLWGVHCYCSYCPRCGTADGAGHRFCAAHIDRQAGTQKESGPVRATLRIGDGDAQRLRHLDIRQAFNIVKKDDGAVVRWQLLDRRRQRDAQFGLARWVTDARRPVGDWRHMPAVLVERRQHLIERDFATSTLQVAKLLVGGIGDDPVEPGAEGRFTPERVDLPDHGPEGVLHDLLGIRVVARDADRQTIDAVAIHGHQGLGGPGLVPARPVHQVCISIRGQAAAGARHVGDGRLLTASLHHDIMRFHLDLPLHPTGLRRYAARYALGVTPVIRRNTVEKWLGVQKPTTCEMWAMDSAGAASSITARSIRSRTTNGAADPCCAGSGERRSTGSCRPPHRGAPASDPDRGAPGYARSPASVLIRAGCGRPRWFAVSSPSSYWADLPPSTRNDAPVMKDALSDERNTMVWATSSGAPTRLSGTVVIKPTFLSSVPVKRFSIPVSIGPGATALTRTPDPAASSAADLVNPSTACLLAA